MGTGGGVMAQGLAQAGRQGKTCKGGCSTKEHVQGVSYLSALRVELLKAKLTSRNSA